ncbi:ESPR-type extended signal peptide-containing protein [Veillonella sp.]
MNKIFKVIWSKSKQCYIVVSEIAKNKTGKKKIVVAGIFAALAMVNGGQATFAAWPAGGEGAQSAFWMGRSSSATGQNAQAIGVAANASSAKSVAIGSDSFAQGVPSGGEANAATAVGAHSNATGPGASAFGFKAIANAGNATAIGTDANVSGQYSVGVGWKSKVTVDNSIAIGEQAKALKEGSSVMGPDARGYGNGSLSLGYQALAGANTYTGAVNNGAPFDDKAATINAYNKWGDAAIGLRAVATGGNATALGRSASATAANAIAIGGGNGDSAIDNTEKTEATGEKSTAIGYNAKAKNTNDIAIGMTANASDGNAIAIGRNVTSAGGASTSIGYYSSVTGNQSIGIGSQISNSAQKATAIGYKVTASGSGAIGIGSGTDGGSNVIASGSDAIALGTSTLADSEKAIAIGANSKGTAIGATALGRSSAATGASATALGSLASATGTTATAVGMQASASGNESLAIGTTASATSGRALAVGTNAKATGENSVAVGSGAGNSGPRGFASSINSSRSVVNTLKTINYATTAEGDNAVALGFYANAKNSGVAVGQNALAATGGVAIGKGVFEDTNNNLAGGVVIGQDSASTGIYSLAMGRNAFATGSTSMAMGYEASANGNFAVAMGRNVTATGTSTAIGHHATASNGGLAIGSQENDASNDKTTASAKGAVAIGKNTTASSEDTVAIGTNAQSDKKGAVALGSGSTTATSATNIPSATINGITYNFAGATNNPNMQVSVGNASATRQIKNVAAGEVSATSTDAINGSQLYAVASAIKPIKYVSINSTATGAGSNVDNDGAQGGNSIAIGPSSTVTKQNGIAIGSGAQSLSEDSVVIGRNAKAETKTGAGLTTTSRAIVIGSNSRVAADITQGVAIGSGLSPDEGAVVTGDQSIAIGGNVKVDGHSAIAIGGDDARKAANQLVSYTNKNDAEVTGTLQTAIQDLTGYNLTDYKGTTAAHAGVAYGTSALAGNAGVAIGTAANSMARMNDKGQVVNNNPVTNAVAIGTAARANFDNSVAIGGGSNTDHYATKQVNAIIDGVEVKWSGGENISPGDVVSFGAKGFERQLKNVAPGEVSQTSTDAVNGSQIYSLARKVTNIMNGGSGSVVNVNATGEPLSKVSTIENGTKVEKYYRTVDVKDDGTLVTGAVAQTPASLALVNVAQTDTNKQTQTPRILGNVANGVKDNDAVNVSQLNAAKVKYFSVNSSDAGNINNDGATGTDAIAIGPSAVSNAVGSVALGKDAKANGDFTVALGGGNWQFKGAQANGVGTTALGSSTKTKVGTNYQTAIGFGASTEAESALAIGYNAAASAQNAIALGRSASTAGQDAVALGSSSQAKGDSGLAIGNGAQANSNSVISLGYQANNGASNNANGVAIGWAAGMQSNGLNNVGVGTNAGRQVIGNNNTSLGNGAGNIANTKIYTSESIMLGTGAKVVGSSATKSIDNVIAIGKNTNGSASSAIAVGINAGSSAENGVAIGPNSNTSAYNGIALGSFSEASTAAGVQGYNVNTNRTDKYAGLTDIALTSKLGAVSVGNSTMTRQITGVAAGTNDTDAVNIAQLKSVNLAFTGNTGSGDVNLANSKLSINGDNTYIKTAANGKQLTISPNVQNITLNNGRASASTGLADASNVAQAINNVVSGVQLDIIANKGTKTGSVNLSNQKLTVTGGNGIRTDIYSNTSGQNLVIGLEPELVNATTKGIGLTGDTGSTGLKYLKDGDATFKVAGDGNLVTTVGSVAGVKVSVDSTKVKDLAVEAVTVSKANTVDNPITVTSTTGNNSKDYAIGIDTTKLAAKTNLAYTANGATAKTVSLAKGLNFVNGTNTVATVDSDGKVSFDLNQATKDSINKSATAVGRTITLNADSGTGSSQSLSNGNVSFAVSGATGDYISTTMDGSAVKVSTKRATIDSDANTGAAFVTGADGLATAKNVASAINSAVNGLSQNLNISDGTNNSSVALKNQKLTVTGTGAAKATVSGQTITIDVAEGTLTPNTTNGTVTGTTGVAKATEVAAAINNTNTVLGNKITKNTQDIATNTSNITANKNQITTNTTNIATNTANIAHTIALADDKGTSTTAKSLKDGNVSFNIKGDNKFISTAASGNDVTLTVNEQAIKDAAKDASSFKVKANAHAEEAVKGGDTIAFNNGDNIEISQTGKAFTIGTAKNITVDSVTAGNTVINTSGLTNGTTAITGTGITTDKVTVGGISIDKTAGINAGGKVISNVASGTVNNNATDDSNAANIGDVKQAVANLSQNLNITDGTNNGTVDLKNQKLNVAGANGVTATVNNQTITVGLDADTVNATTKGIGLTADTGSTGNKYLKDGDVSFAVTGDGNLVSTSATAAGVKVAVDTAKVKDLAVSAVTVSKDTQADNPITVTPTAGTNSKDYAIGIDTTKLAAKTDLTYRANSAADANAKKVSLSKGLDFVDGGSTVATVDNDGKVSFDLNTATKTQINTNTADIATNKGNIVTNTADIATNKGNITKNTAAIATNATAIARNITLGADTGTASSQSLSKADVAFNVKGATGDFVSTNMNGNTVEISTTRATINSNATTGEASVTGADGLATAKNVSDAINKAAEAAKAGAAWSITTNSSTTDKTAVKGGDTVDLVNGDNIEITQDGTDKKKITVATKKDITVDSVTANNKVTVGSGANAITLNGADGSVTGKAFTGTTFTGTSFIAGNTVINTNGLTNGTTAITGTGVTTDTLTVGGISIDKTDGINAGGKVISNVASGGTTVTNAANIGDIQTAVGNQNLKFAGNTNTAAGVVNIKDDTFNIIGDGKYVSTDANGKNLTVKVSEAEVKKSAVAAVTVSTDTTDANNPLTVTPTTSADGTTKDYKVTIDGTKIANKTNLSYKANDGTAKQVSLADGLNFKNGTLTTASIDDAGIVKYDVNTAAITAGTDGTVTGPTTDGVATAQNVADAINAAKKASKTEITANTGEAANATTGNVTLTSTTAADGHTIYDVKLNDKVTLGTGANAVTIDGTAGKATIGSSVVDGVNNTITTGGTNSIKVDGATGTVTGLTNKDWTPGVTKAVTGRAATEDQLQKVADAASSQTWNITADKAGTTGAQTGTKKNATVGKDETVELVAGDNLTINQDERKFTYSLNKALAGLTSVSVGDGTTETIKLDGATGKVTAKNAVIGGVTVDGDNSHVTGLSNTTWNGTATTGRAATEDQLKAVADTAKATTDAVNLKFSGDTNTSAGVVNLKDDTFNIVGDGKYVTTDANGKDLTVKVSEAEVKKSAVAAVTVSTDTTDANNPISVTPTTSADGTTKDYKVTIDGTKIANKTNLSYKANDGTAKQVSLADGLNFKNGTLTTASIDDAGVVKYDVNTAAITVGTDGTVTGPTTDGVVTAQNVADAINAAKKAAKTEITANTSEAANATTGNVTLTSTTAADGHTIYDVKLNDKVTLGSGANAVTIDGTAGKATVGTAVVDGVNNTITTGGANTITVDGAAGTVTGLTNKDWTPGVTKAVTGRAATEDQLQKVADAASSQTWNITADKAGTTGAQTGTKKNATVGKDQTVELVAGDNFTINQDERKFTYSLNKDLAGLTSVSVGDGTTETIKLDGATGKVTAKNAVIGGVTVDGDNSHVTGLSNTTWNGTATTGRAATEDQLKAVADTAKATTDAVNLKFSGDTNTSAGVVNLKDDTFNIVGDGKYVTTDANGKDLTVKVSEAEVKKSAVAAVTVSTDITDANNPISVTPTTSADGTTKDYKVTIDGTKIANKTNLSYKANDGTAKQVSLADGLNFKNGTLTTASIDDAGVVKYDINTAAITAGADGTVTGPTTDGVATAQNVADAINVAKKASKTEITANTGEAANATTGNVTLTSTTAADGHTIYDVKLNDKVTLGTGNNAVTIDGTAGKATIGSSVVDGVNNTITTGGANAVALDGAAGTVKTGTVTVTGGTTNDITGLSNTTVNSVDFATKGRAATEEQLKAVGEQTWQITADKEATTSGNQTGTKKDAKVGKDDKVQLIAGENLTVNQNERDFTYSLNKDLVKMNSATFEATGGKTTVITGDSIAQTDGTKTNRSTAAGNTVADGGKSTATTADGTTVTNGADSTATTAAGTTVTNANGNTNYAADGVRINTTGKNPVSLTDAGLDNGNNVIKNVASGHVNNDDTDNTNAANIADVKKATTTVTANNGEAANATTGNVTLTSTTAADGHTIYDVKLNDKVTLGTGTNAVTIDGTTGKATIGSSVVDGVNNTITTGGVNAVALDGAAGTVKTGTVTVTGGTTNDITGLSNTTVNSADFATKGRAATEEQLKQVGEQTWQITADKDATTSGNQTGTKKDAKVGKDDKVQLIAGENLTVNQNERDFTYSLNKDLMKMNSATFEATGGKTTVITGDSIVQTAGTQTNTSTAVGNTVADGTKSTETTAAGQVIKDGAKTNTSTVDENTLVDGAKSNKITVDSNVINDGNGNANTSNATSNTITDGTNTSTVTAGKAQIGTVGIDGVASKLTTGGANAVVINGADGTVKTGTVTLTGGTTNDITGLSNTAVNSADFATKGRAATEEQLKQVGEQTWQITADKDATTSGNQTGTKKDAKVGKDDKVQLIAGENLTVNQNERDFTFSLNKDLVKLNSATFEVTGGKTTVITGDSITQTDGTKTNTSTAASNTVADGGKSTATTADGTTVTNANGNTKYAADGVRINTTGKNPVSLTDAGLDNGNNVIKNVASGHVNNDDTDNTNAANIADVKKATTTVTANNGEAANATTGNVTLTSTTATDGHTIYDVKLNDKVTLGTGANAVTIDGTAGKATIGSSVVDGVNNTITTGGANAVVLDGAAGTVKTGTVTVTGGTTNDITGLSNTTVTSADFATKGRAATEEQLKAVGEQTWQITADKDATTSGNQIGTKKDAKVGKDDKVQLIAGENLTVNQNERDFTYSLNKDLVKMNSATFEATGGKTTVITGNSISQTDGTKTNTSTAAGNTVADGTKSTETTAAGQVIKDGAKSNKSTVDSNVIDDGNGNVNTSNATSNTITDGTNTSAITAGKAIIGSSVVDGVNNTITTGGANAVALDGVAGTVKTGTVTVTGGTTNDITGLSNTTVNSADFATKGRAATEEQLKAVGEQTWQITADKDATTSGNQTGTKKDAKVGKDDKVQLIAGENLTVNQNERDFTYSLNKDLVKMNSATFEATGGKTTVIKGDSIVQTDGTKTNISTAAGNTVADGTKSTETTAAGYVIKDGAKSNKSTVDSNVIDDGNGNVNTSNATSNTIANGTDSTATTAAGTTVTNANGNTKYAADGVRINTTGKNPVSLTDAGLDNGNNVIKNVASGHVNNDDTDNTNAANIADVKKATTTVTANNGEAANATTGNVTLTSTTATDGHIIYDVKLNDKVTLGTGANAVTIDGTAGKATIGSSVVDGVNNTITTGGANAVVLDGAAGSVKTGTVTVTGGTTNDITGLSNTTVTSADFATKGRAATEEQLKAVGEQTWQITADKDATTSGNQTGTKKDAKVGKDDKVQLIAGENLTVNQNERDFTYSLNKDLVKMNSATFEATGGKTTVITGDSIAQTDGTKTNTSTAAGNTVADGGKSTATTADGTTVTNANGNTNYAADGVRINTTGKNPVSLTDAGLDNGNNVIKNVASGHVNNDDTDNTNAANIADVKKATTTVTANNGEAANATTGNVTLTSTTAADGHTIYDVKLNDTVTLGTGANAVTIDGTAGKATIGSSVVDGVNNTITTGGANAVVLDGAAGTVKTGTVTVTGGTTNDITGLSNTTVTSADFATKGRAATEEQLKQVGEQTWQITADKDATTSGNQTGTKKDAKVGKDDKVQLIAGENLTVNQNERDFTYSLNKDLVKMNSATFEATGGKTTVITGSSIAQTDGTKTNTSTAAGNTVADGTKSTETTAAGQVIKDGAKTNTSTVDENTLVDGAKSNKTTVDSNVIDDGNGNVNTSNATSNTITDGTNTTEATASTVTVKDNAGNSTVITKDTLTTGTGANKVTVDGTAGKVTAGSAVVDGVNNTITTGGANTVKLDGAAGTVTGLTNTAWTPGVTKAMSGRAATEDQLQQVSDAVGAGWNINSGTVAGSTGEANGSAKTKISSGEEVQLQAGNNLIIDQNGKTLSYSLNKNLKDMESAIFNATGGKTTVIKGDSIVQTDGGKTNTSNAAGNTVVDGTKSTATTAAGTTITDGAKTNTSTADKNVINDGAGNTNTSNATSNTIADPNGNTNTATATNNTLADNAGNSNVSNATSNSLTDNAGNSNVSNATSNTLKNAAGDETKVDAKGATVKDAAGNTTNVAATGATVTNAAGDTTKVEATGTTVADAAGNKATFTKDGVTITKPGKDTVSLTGNGLDNGNNKIVNVADGTNDTDAVNVRQLDAKTKAATTELTANGGESADNTTGNIVLTKTTAPDGHIIYDNKLNDKITLGAADPTKAITVDGTNGTIKAGKDGNAVAINGTDGTIKAGDGTNAVAIDGVNGSVKVADKIALNGKDGKAAIGTVGIDGKDGIITTGGNNPVAVNGKDGVVTGLTNKTWDPNNITSGRAATEDQVQSAVANAGWDATVGTEGSGVNSTPSAIPEKIRPNETLTFKAGNNMMVSHAGKTISYAVNPDLTDMKSATFKDAAGNTTVINGNGITITPGSANPNNPNAGPVSLTKDGLNNGNNQIKGVAPGSDDTDAVNIGQLKASNAKMGDAIGQVAGEVQRVGAHAAAMAALKPIQYDPLEPTQIMAGVGNYRGETAAALGLAHYTNEDTMFNVGVSVGGNHNMVNAGVTHKFGSSPEKKNIPDRYKAGPISSVYVMQDEVSSLKKENAEQKYVIADQAARLNTLEAENERQRQELAETKQGLDDLRAAVDKLLAAKG